MTHDRDYDHDHALLFLGILCPLAIRECGRDVDVPFFFIP
jgi:hypothetical protein